LPPTPMRPNVLSQQRVCPQVIHRLSTLYPQPHRRRVVNSRHSGRRTWRVRRASYGYYVGRGVFRIPLRWVLWFLAAMAALEFGSRLAVWLLGGG